MGKSAFPPMTFSYHSIEVVAGATQRLELVVQEAYNQALPYYRVGSRFHKSTVNYPMGDMAFLGRNKQGIGKGIKQKGTESD